MFYHIICILEELWTYMKNKCFDHILFKNYVANCLNCPSDDAITDDSKLKFDARVDDRCVLQRIVRECGWVRDSVHGLVKEYFENGNFDNKPWKDGHMRKVFAQVPSLCAS